MIRHVIPILLLPSVSIAQNICIHDFERAKELHEDFVYRDHNITLYCKAIFEGKKLTQPEGFTTSKYKNREHSLEWEHVSFQRPVKVSNAIPKSLHTTLNT